MLRMRALVPPFRIAVQPTKLQARPPRSGGCMGSRTVAIRFKDVGTDHASAKTIVRSGPSATPSQAATSYSWQMACWAARAPRTVASMHAFVQQAFRVPQPSVALWTEI